MRSRGIAVILSLCVATAAHAVTIPVSTTSMTVANDGQCSLVEAIVSANTDMASGIMVGECPAGSGADSISLQVGATYTVTTGAFGTGNGADALPPITTVIAIDGNGARLERAMVLASFRLIEVLGGTLTLSAITIANGHTVGGFDDDGDGGCIFSNGNLVITDSVLTGCRAGDAEFGSAGYGGAIFAKGGSLSVSGSLIELSGAGDAPGIGGNGGGIAAMNIPVTIEDTRVHINAAGSGIIGGHGGGIWISDGTLALRSSTVSFNAAGSSSDFDGAPGNGGGISVSTADVSIDSSSIHNNTAGTNPFRSGTGGGIHMSGAGSLEMSGSSVVSNASGAGVSATLFAGNAGEGGGFYVLNATGVTIVGSEIRGNTTGNGGNATAPGGQGGDGGSGAAMWIDNVPSLRITGSLIEDNVNGNGGNAAAAGFSGQGGYGAVALRSVGSATIADTMLRANRAGNGGSSAGSGSFGGNGGRGGALVAEQSNFSMLRSAVVGNNAGNGGGGDSVGGGGHGGGLHFASNSSVEIVNTTIDGNVAGQGGTATEVGAQGGPGGDGGGVATDTNFILINSTLSDNGAGQGGNGNGGGGIGFAGRGGNLYVISLATIANSVLANSVFAGDCFKHGTVNNGGNNIVEDNSCGFTGGSDPRLAPLALNGGNTLSRALCTAAGVPDASCVGPSPAIDAGADMTCNATAVDGIDQRAALRSAGAHCDIGAIESNANASIAMTGNAALFPGGSACIGVSAAPGYPLDSLTAQMTFDGTELALVDSQINPLIGPSTASDKQLSHVALSSSSDLFTVSGGNGPVPAGVAFTAVFTAAASTPPGVYPISPLPLGNLVVTNCAGDCDGSGSVTLPELQRCTGKFLGQPLCDLQEAGRNCTVADSDIDGVMSLGDVQRCANRFVGSCF